MVYALRRARKKSLFVSILFHRCQTVWLFSTSQNRFNTFIKLYQHPFPHSTHCKVPIKKKNHRPPMRRGRGWVGLWRGHIFPLSKKILYIIRRLCIDPLHMPGKGVEPDICTEKRRDIRLNYYFFIKFPKISFVLP